MRNVLVAIGLTLVCVVAVAEEPHLAANAPQDKPQSGDPAKVDRAIAPLVAKARKTYPGAKKRYVAGLPHGEIFFVTMRLTEGKTSETFFLRVKKIAGGKISGVVSNEIMRLKGVHLDDMQEVAEKDILDWTISKPDGTEDGNIVGKFLDTYKP